MKYVSLFMFVAASLIFVFSCDCFAETDGSTVEPFYYVIPVHGPIDGSTYGLFKVHLDKARILKAPVIVLDVDSPGGQVYVAEKIIKEIIEAKEFTFHAFIHKAMSAAAAISLTCQNIYMDENSSIGAAVSFMAKNGKIVDLPEDVKAKFQSVWRATMRNAAIAGGHDPLFAEGMTNLKLSISYSKDTDGNVQLYSGMGSGILGKALKRSGTILCMTATEAVDTQLSAGIVKDYESLSENLGIKSWRDVGRVDLLKKQRVELPRGFSYPDNLIQQVIEKADQLGLGSDSGTRLGRQSANTQLEKWMKSKRIVGRQQNWVVTMLDASESETQFFLELVNDALAEAKPVLKKMEAESRKKSIERKGDFIITRDKKRIREALGEIRAYVSKLNRTRRRLTTQPVQIYAYSPYVDNLIINAWVDKRSLVSLSEVPAGSDIMMTGKVSYFRYGPFETGEPFWVPDIAHNDHSPSSDTDPSDWVIWIEMEQCRFIDKASSSKPE